MPTRDRPRASGVRRRVPTRDRTHPQRQAAGACRAPRTRSRARPEVAGAHPAWPRSRHGRLAPAPWTACPALDRPRLPVGAPVDPVRAPAPGPACVPPGRRPDKLRPRQHGHPPPGGARTCPRPRGRRPGQAHAAPITDAPHRGRPLHANPRRARTAPTAGGSRTAPRAEHESPMAGGPARHAAPITDAPTAGGLRTARRAAHYGQTRQSALSVGLCPRHTDHEAALRSARTSCASCAAPWVMPSTRPRSPTRTSGTACASPPPWTRPPARA